MCPPNEPSSLEGLPKKESDIRIEVNGQEVLGSFLHLRSSDLSIIIDSPYKDIRASSFHLAYFAMVWRERWFADSNGITERGRLESKELLKNIFLSVQYVENNLDNFRKTFIEICDTIKSKNPNILISSDLSNIKASLKKKFLLKEIDQRYYQGELKKLKNLSIKYSLFLKDINTELREYIKNQSSAKIYEDTCDDIIEKYIISSPDYWNSD